MLNRFEQFCINLTNEKLQQHFNQHVFKMEQEEYTKEEINWSYIDFVDNKDILELIEKKPGGIIALLDEACVLPRSTHETFAQKLYQTYKNHKRISKPKLSRSDFTIHHYAGDVTYQTDLFLDKNKDYVIAEHQSLLSVSKCSFVSGLFPILPEDSSKSSKFSSIGTRFKQQLQSLLETLSTTEPHYIRCVKPNNLLKPAIFENNNVLQQLRCGGVLEAIRISCAGYPTRRTFDEFIDRFGILAPNVLDGGDEVTVSKKLLEKIGLEGYQIGKTKVFLRAGQLAELDTRRVEVLGRSARIIQRKVRSYLSRRSFILLRKSAIQLQASCRGHLARNLFENLRRNAASLRIQKYFRRCMARKAYKELLFSTVIIQASVRGLSARKEFLFRRQTKAAVVIQSHCRQYLARLHYMRIKKAAITTQCAWRARMARGELKKLKMAARETGALQAAKNKLEKQVEELTWRLQLEKRMRVDLEEAKTLENSKLQTALQEVQQQCKETKALLLKEKETAKRTAEEAANIREVPVFDTPLMNRLTTENEKLKALVNSLEKKIDETEQKFEEASRVGEESLKKALEAESKIHQLNNSMQRLKEKLSDIETENQVLRQQSLINSPIKPMSEHLSIRTTPVKHDLENGHFKSEAIKEPQSAPPTIKEHANLSTKSMIAYTERQYESVDTLFNCVTKNIGFSNGKPVAALTIYKCLLQWKSFESEKTGVFDRLIQMIGSAIENDETYDNLAYCLSNTTALLFLLHKSLRAAGSAPRKKPPPISLFGRMTQGFRSSPSSANLAMEGVDLVVRQVEAKYPALLFKQQLTAYVEKIYGIIRDNMKKDLTHLLTSCIQAPRTLKASINRGSSRSGSFGHSGHSGQTSHWQSIIESLNSLLKTLQQNHVPVVLIQKVFTQVFSFINMQLFNSLLLRRECCSFSNGEYVKSGLADLELWCAQAKPEYAGSAWEELKHIRQGVGFLVIFQKYRISYDDIVNDLCPVLSVQQLYRICTQYWDDKYNTQSVSSSVLSSMRVLMTEDSNTAVSDAFLLDDNTSIIPFSADDISSSLQEKDFVDVKPATELLENPAFQFLQD